MNTPICISTSLPIHPSDMFSEWVGAHALNGVSYIMTSMIETQFKDPIYRTCLRVIVGPHKELEDMLKEWDVEYDGDSSATQGRLVRIAPGDSKADPEANMTVIWLKEKNIPVLAHELLHHLVRTFDEKFIPMDWDNTEVMSYFMEYLMQQVLDSWKMKKKKGKLKKVL